MGALKREQCVIHNSSSKYFSFKGKTPQNPAETISIFFHIFLPKEKRKSPLQADLKLKKVARADFRFRPILLDPTVRHHDIT